MGSPPPQIASTPYKAGSAVLSPKPASFAPLTGPVKAALTSSQVPRDEAEEEADDVSQVLLAAVVAFLKPQSSPPGWAWSLPTPCHPWAGPHPGGPSSCPQLGLTSYSAGHPQPAPSFLCLPLPNLTLRAFLLEFSLPRLWSVSPLDLNPDPQGLGLSGLRFPLPSSVLRLCLLFSQPSPGPPATQPSAQSIQEMASPLPGWTSSSSPYSYPQASPFTLCLLWLPRTLELTLLEAEGLLQLPGLGRGWGRWALLRSSQHQ